ncbi:hypothetical protein [Cytobacillus oceanisediminis]|uniref:hypothetical protein n=1 Tax=Cytobacillus oceanisediminis TaxID=665099 RepID=UPI001159190B|nr:hypothetical protein [Cytobacillus oceanisediminis]
MDAKTLNQWQQFSFVAGFVCLFSGTAFTIAIGEKSFIFLCVATTVRGWKKVPFKRFLLLSPGNF